MENTDVHTTTHTPESAPKKPRGRPAKYAKEEREQKYKEASKQWHRQHYKEHAEEEKQQAIEYQARARSALKLLNDIWLHRDEIEFKSDRFQPLIRELIENKKIIAL